MMSGALAVPRAAPDPQGNRMNSSSTTTSRAAGPARGIDPAVLSEIVRRIVQVAQPDRIILFGSAARGDMSPDSDLDFLVIKSGVAHRRRLAQEIYVALVGVLVPVDVVVVTPEDVAAYGDCVGAILRPALREGREVYAA